jgi:hypothetical protein
VKRNETKVADLGHAMARLGIDLHGNVRLNIVTPSDPSEPGYTPAESVSLLGDSIVKLKELLAEYKPGDERPSTDDEPF